MQHNPDSNLVILAPIKNLEPIVLEPLRIVRLKKQQKRPRNHDVDEWPGEEDDPKFERVPQNGVVIQLLLEFIQEKWEHLGRLFLE